MSIKCLTTIRNIKNRTVGHKTGSCVYTAFDTTDGKLKETDLRPPKDDDDDFDNGTQKKKPKPKPAPSGEKDY